MANKRKSMPIPAEKLQLSGDEDQSDDNTLTVPIKRKRGRPTTTGEPKAPVQKKEVVPRGRGRPRKVKGVWRGGPRKVKTTEVPDEVENGYSSTGEVENADDNSKSNAENMSPGKGRGRPKKA